MFGLGVAELIVIAVLALLIVGPDGLPSAAKNIGKGIRDLRKQKDDLQNTIEKDTQIGDAVRELRSAMRGDPEPFYAEDMVNDEQPSVEDLVATNLAEVHDGSESQSEPAKSETDAHGDGDSVVIREHGDAVHRDSDESA